MNKRRTPLVHLFALCLIALGMAPTLFAQILGCTDPVANNFSASATQNDGSCTYANANITPLTSVALSSVLAETSGLISWNSSLWNRTALSSN